MNCVTPFLVENGITGSDICYDTDNGATDIWRDGCSWYNDNVDKCGKYDDDDFKAKSMCCSCKPGDEKL